jgi:hypothetical protein
MAKKQADGKTAYQNLNNFFGLESGRGFEGTQDDNKNEPKIIIKGSSPQDIQRKSLELQQKKALQDKFFKQTDHGFQKAMQYEAARLPAYLDFEGMEYYPIIASAMDLMMEESTTFGDNGQMMNIYSDKQRIKEHLEELFYDVINVNVNLPFWTRNLVKYGDNFVYMLGEKKKGLTHVKQLVNYEIERIERVENGKPTVKFRNRETGDDFNIFEIAHFRLLGDDKYLPYGSSTLNKVRRVFRQLVMAEDAMLTYRIIRAGEKRVFKIDVGNLDEDDMEEYIQKVATRFKKQQQVYPDSGQIDYRFNILGNDEDFFIPVRNANVQTGIDTLQGAQNLDQIQDIEYLRDNLFTGLGIPKPFLGFQDAAGEGQNLAQMDVRFTKKINRIQQAMIQELNKMAIIHLYLLGFDKEDLNNFTLMLTNPSTQQDMLKAELWSQKIGAYTEATRNEGGIAAMSHTEAKRLFFNWSDRDIIEDFKKQRMERAIAQELQDTPLIIRQTGIFTDIDEKFGDPEAAAMMSGQTGMEGGMDELGGGLGGELGGGMPPPLEGGANDFGSPASLPPVIGQGKGFKENGNVIYEEEGKLKVMNVKRKMTDSKFNGILEGLVNDGKNESVAKEIQNKKIIKETENRMQTLNQNAKDMISEIDGLLEEGDTINKEKKINEEKINGLDLEEFNLDDKD